MKKFLSLMIALVFCMALLPMTALATSDVTIYIYGGAGGAGGEADSKGNGGDGGYVGFRDGDEGDTAADNEDGGPGIISDMPDEDNKIPGALAGGGGGGGGSAKEDDEDGGDGGDGAPVPTANKGVNGGDGTKETTAGKGGNGGIAELRGDGGAAGTPGATAGGGGGGGVGAELVISEVPMDDGEPIILDLIVGGGAAGGDEDGGGGDGGSAFVDITETLSIFDLDVTGGDGHNDGGDGGNAYLDATNLTVTGEASVTGGDNEGGGNAYLDAAGSLTTETTLDVTGGTGTGAGKAYLRAGSLTTGGVLTVESTAEGKAELIVTNNLTAKNNITLTKGAADLEFRVNGLLIVDGNVTLDLGNDGDVIFSTLVLHNGTLTLNGDKATMARNLTVRGLSTLATSMDLEDKILTATIPVENTAIVSDEGIEGYSTNALLTFGSGAVELGVDGWNKMTLGLANGAELNEGDVITLLKMPNGATFTVDEDVFGITGDQEPSFANPILTYENEGYTFDFYYVEEDTTFGYLLAMVTDVSEPGTPGRSSSSGCDAGAFGLFALLAIPLLSMKKKEK